jgi:ribosomal protein S18 acetylase RimI-like enzyme
LPTLRRAQTNDAEAIAALVSEAYAPYITRIGRKPAPMLDDYRQVIEQNDTFVLTENAEVVGVLVMSNEGAELLLVNVAVSPSQKGKGFGKQLMAFCEEHALKLGCKAVRLYTHELMVENIAIYEKLGYRETRRATEDGFARVFMRKDALGEVDQA